MKKCTICKQLKEFTMFNKDKSRHDGIHATCKSCCKLRRKNHYIKHKETILESNREWKISNKESYRASERIRENERRLTDPLFKLKKIVRNRLYSAIKYGLKSGSAVNDLGCTVDFLKIYIESKFQIGMNWENHGEWELDHIIPLSKFDLTNREELLIACNYKNLQPLWKKDHLEKTKYDIYSNGDISYGNK